ncbi:MAG: hypothetical protein R3237_05620 [Nitrosopumilaceae archaeon]|nr:hypothetical protein [Nitrosopumilaceae archaeon]
MRKRAVVCAFVVLLLMPVYANAQTSDRITILDNFGEYDRGEYIFVYGKVANPDSNSFLIMQIVNPLGDLCQIQQLIPLSDGAFITEVIPLDGRICGIPGEYEIKLFYGNYSKSSIFQVTSNYYSKPSPSELLDNAENLVLNQIDFVDSEFGIGTTFFNRLNLAVSNNDLEELKDVYVDLGNEFYSENFIFEIDPALRPAITSSLNSVSTMLENDEISFDVAKSIDSEIFSAVFYYEIGDKKTGLGILSDAFVEVGNVNPQKTLVKVLTFDEIEELLLNLMKKANTILTRPVKEEIGFIFARGTGPLYTSELSDLVDLLSKARYLDVVSRKQSDLDKIIIQDWNNTKTTFETKFSIEEVLENKEKTLKLHRGALILNNLDNVDRFISSNFTENSDLAKLLEPDWNSLKSKLERASSVDDIIESESEITKMKQTIDISSRISKSIEISKEIGINDDLAKDWEQLLDKVEAASSIDEIFQIVLEFEKTMNDLREKRNPISILKFDYQAMKEQAELQADYNNLFLIENALKILDTAEQMQSGNPSITRIDRIEVLLVWVSEMAPKIKSDLDKQDEEAIKIRAANVLQRAKSLENLVELSMTKNRFLPGFIEFSESFNEKIDDARDLVIANDIDAADHMVRDLFTEWRQVSFAYENDPYGSPEGYDLDELKRIEFREKLDAFSTSVSNFNHAGFAQYSEEFNKMISDAYDLIEIGNFVDVEAKLLEIAQFLTEHLVTENPRIIYNISYDLEKDIWILRGAVEKSRFDDRENLYVTIFNMDGSKHSNLKFTDTRHGDFHTQWFAPVEPGLYFVTLQYQNVKATQIINIEEEFDYEYSETDYDIVELAREFEELQTFVEKFGGEEYSKEPRFSEVIADIKLGLANRDEENVDEKLEELKRLIERYLPIRSRSAIIEAQYDGNLVLSGAVQKSLAFREDLFVDIFDQQGGLVQSIALKDDSSGRFNELVQIPFEPGVYVAQLEYHNVIVNDFFAVR